MMALETISLRPAIAGDRDLVLGWRNDPFIIARGTNQRSVGAAEHGAWFGASLADASRRLWIVSVGTDPAGLVRFDREERSAAVVSVYLIQRFCGRGLGVAAIREGSRLALETWPIERVIAYVRTDNEGGRRAFLRAGFALEAIDACPSGHVALVLHR